MSSAGMGDALAGLIASLMAQGLEPIDAASQGVALHARTADALLPRMGWGMGASDLVEALADGGCRTGEGGRRDRR